MDTKLTFSGLIISIQPRIRLLRSFDESSHTYLGYAITLDWQPGHMRLSVAAACGAVGCLLRLLYIQLEP